MINALIGLIGMTFMPVTTGGAALKKFLAAQGIDPYSIPFKALKEIAEISYETSKYIRGESSSSVEQYMKSLEYASYAIADYMTKPFEACNPDSDYICKILCSNGVPPRQ